MSKLYMYVVDRDFGFAPNPFHGHCTLATCKPDIRARARAGDLIVGMGGARLKATGRCVFAMVVDKAISLNEYWFSVDYLDKRPVRNGSKRMMVGDNIYCYDETSKSWSQADSHHSNPDGTANDYNVHKDTKTDKVLIAEHFVYFGREAPQVPEYLLQLIGYRNGRYYRVFEHSARQMFLEWLDRAFPDAWNMVLADPFDFENSGLRYSAADNRVR